MAKKKKPEKRYEALLWRVERRGIRCRACARNCFIGKQKRGYCGVRENDGKRLIALNFGKFIFLDEKSIESLPMYHFLPGSQTLCVASIGSNFKGKIGFKQGYEASLEKARTYQPEDLVKTAERKKVKSIAFLGTPESEPFVYAEFANRCSRLALRSNISNVYVTNGFGSVEAIKRLAKYMQAALVVLYAFCDENFYKKFANVKRIDKIFDAIFQLKKQRIFMEIAVFIVPELGDSLEKCREFASWIINELGSEIPLHLLQFYSPEFADLPATPIETLERCAEEVRRCGLRYVYLSNFPHSLNNTYCYNCLQTVIERTVNKLEKVKLIDGRCPNCGFRINIKLE